MTHPKKPSGWLRKAGLCLAGLVLIVLVSVSLSAPLLSWPFMDEAYMLLASRDMANGLLPYRDFYLHVTPGTAILGALYAKLSGFSITGLRLLVICGWLLEMMLIYDMARTRLSRFWIFFLLAFLGLTAIRYPIYQHHFWSGFFALGSVYFAWRYLRTVYTAQRQNNFLWLSGLFTALALWCTQSLGIVLMLALGSFGLLHGFLHEREEKDLTYRQIANTDVLRRWLGTWGRHWLFPQVISHLLFIGLLANAGILDVFLRDTVFWLAEGNYQKGTIIGYFSTFQQEFMQTVAPLLGRLPFPAMIPFLLRIPIACHLFLIGLLPVLGIVGTGLLLPGRFLFRLLRLEDEELLLWWITGTGMILATFSYSTAMHIASNGTIAFLLGVFISQSWFSKRPTLQSFFHKLAPTCLFLVLCGMAFGSLLQLQLGTWLPRFPGLPEQLLYTETQTTPQAFLNLVKVLESAGKDREHVFIFGESAALYLTGHYRNATRYTLLFPAPMVSKAQRRELLRELAEKRPLYIVDDQASASLQGDRRFRHYPPEALHIPELRNYIGRHYKPYALFDRFVVYRRT